MRSLERANLERANLERATYWYWHWQPGSNRPLLLLRPVTLTATRSLQSITIISISLGKGGVGQTVAEVVPVVGFGCVAGCGCRGDLQLLLTDSLQTLCVLVVSESHNSIARAVFSASLHLRDTISPKGNCARGIDINSASGASFGDRGNM